MSDYDILSCLPVFLQEIKEFKIISELLQPYIDGLFSILFEIPKEKSIQTASERGLAIWEHFLKMDFGQDTPLDEKRAMLEAILRGEGSGNYNSISKKIYELCGEENVTIEYLPDEYVFNVNMSLRSKGMKEAVFELIDSVVPANYTISLKIKYIYYGLLNSITYKEASNYTYEQLNADADLIEKLGG